MADKEAEVQQPEPAAEPQASAEPSLSELQETVQATQRQLAALQGELKGRARENESLKRDLRDRDTLVEKITTNFEERLAAALDEFAGASQEEAEPQPVTPSQRFKQRFKREAETRTTAQPSTASVECAHNLQDLLLEKGINPANPPSDLNLLKVNTYYNVGRFEDAVAEMTAEVERYMTQKEASVNQEKKAITEKRQQLASNAGSDRTSPAGSTQRKWDKKSLENLMGADTAKSGIKDLAAAIEESMNQGYARR